MAEHRITYRRRPQEPGPRVFVRAVDVRLDGRLVGSVVPLGGHSTQPFVTGWYVVIYPGAVCKGTELVNTSSAPVATLEMARDQIKQLIREHVKQRKAVG